MARIRSIKSATAFKFIVNVLSVLVLSPAVLPAQVTDLRLTDPVVADPNVSGWSVEDSLGRLKVSIPITRMPGEISFPIAFTMSGSFQAKARATTKYQGNVPVTTYIVANEPIWGGLHFGYITADQVVLENGRSYRSSDFAGTTSAMQALFVGNSRVSQGKLPLAKAFGFDWDRAPYTGWLMNAQADLIRYCVDSTTFFGSKYGPIVAANVPSGFQLSTPGQYTVLMDRDLARVFVTLNMSTPEGQAYKMSIPILFADRFGHYVTLKWSHHFQIAGLFIWMRVEVLNQRGQGAVIRWGDWAVKTGEQDLARVDFVKISAPSMLVKGYGGTTAALPTGYTRPAAYKDGSASADFGLGVFRPTTITIGNPATLGQPSWSGCNSITTPPADIPAAGSGEPRTWTFGYDANLAEIVSITTPWKVKTTFATGTHSVPVGGTANADLIRGVYQATEVDGSGKGSDTRTLSWSRSISNPTITVTSTDVWNGATNTNLRYTFNTYGGTTTDYANQFLKTSAVWSTSNFEFSKVAYVSRTGGLNNTLSLVASTTTTRSGQAPLKTDYTFKDAYGLQVSKITGNVSGKKYAEVAYEYAGGGYWDMLAPDLVRVKAITRYNTISGNPITPGKLFSRVWDDWNGDVPPNVQLKLACLGSSPSAGGAGSAVLVHGSEYTYDGDGRPSTRSVYHSESSNVDTASPCIQTTTYDSATGLPNQLVTQYQNGSGNSSITTSQSDFDSGHRPQLFEDEKGASTRTTYDLYGRPLSLAKDGEATMTFSYTDDWTKVTSQAGKTTTTRFDGFGRLIKQELPDGRTVVPKYDLYGRVVRTSETNNVGVSRVSYTFYDLLDRITSQTSVTGKRVCFTYSTEGSFNVVTQTVAPAATDPPAATSLNLVTITKTDPFGQVVSVQTPNGVMTTSTYDGSGKRTQVIIIPGACATCVGPAQARLFQYDLLGRLTWKKEPETGEQTFSNFNALNQPQTIKEWGLDRAKPARTRTLAYDGLGRLRSQAGGSVVETFTYTGALLTASQRTSGADAVTQSFEYTGPGKRLSKESTTQGLFSPVIRYIYDDQARLSTLTYPSGKVAGYTYDALDRVTKVTYNGQNVVSQIIYDAWGNPKRRSFKSGAMDEWNYDDASHARVTQWTIGIVGGTPQARTYGYDAADRLTKAGEWSKLAYDTNSRLTQAVGFGFTNNLVHDAYDNNNSSVSNSTGTVPSSMNNFTFDSTFGSMMATNHLPAQSTNGGLTQIAENNFGEITTLGTGISSSGSLTMTWDDLGRMTSTKFGSAGAGQSFIYAASGLRVRRTDSVANGGLCYAYASNGSLLTVYGFSAAHPTPWVSSDLLYLGSEAIAQIDSDGVYAYHNDHLGTPRVITNAAGTVAGTRAYGPYGEIIQWGGSFSPRIGYAGHLVEPTGLIYMRGRFYSPAWHRFMNSNQGVDPNLLNQFAYTIGNPLMNTDPSGMDNCPNTDGRSPESRAAGGVGHNGDMSGKSGGDPGHSSLESGERYGKEVAKEIQDSKTLTGQIKQFFNKLRNLSLGVGFIPDSQVPAALAEMKIDNPLKYGLITSNDPVIRGLLNGGLIGGITAPEFMGGQLTESGFVEAANSYLGPGYTEVSPGRFVSADGLRQMRLGPHEVNSVDFHGHFEAYENGRVVENTRVNIKPD